MFSCQLIYCDAMFEFRLVGLLHGLMESNWGKIKVLSFRQLFKICASFPAYVFSVLLFKSLQLKILAKYAFSSLKNFEVS